MSLWAVIMAGGSGRRFWPVSRETNPKQFLKLQSEQSLIEQTIHRVSHVVDEDHIIIVSAEKHQKVLREVLPSFPEDQILWEPKARNTAPCIAWANAFIKSRDSEALIGVFPSDHYIEDEDTFAHALRLAYDHAASQSIVLFGIQPTRPETGYGYIEQDVSSPSLDADEMVYKVRRFTEKPDLDTAKTYLERGNYVWNSGIFVFSAQTMDSEIARFLPSIWKGVEELIAHPEDVLRIFNDLPSISIDYGIMERTEKAVVMRASFSWNDVGAWNAISSFYPKDSEGNSASGDVIMKGCHDTFIFSKDDRLISVIGLDNLIVVSTTDALLVMSQSESQNVQYIVKELEKRERFDLL